MIGAEDLEVLDGASGAVLFSAQPVDDFTGGVFVSLGDMSGDKKAELVVTPDTGGGPRVIAYRGGDFAKIDDFFGIDDPAFRGGARTALGDVNGDGYADLAVSAGFGGGSRISIYDGHALGTGFFHFLKPPRLLLPSRSSSRPPLSNCWGGPSRSALADSSDQSISDFS